VIEGFFAFGKQVQEKCRQAGSPQLFRHKAVARTVPAAAAAMGEQDDA
jgi:hypothetical protein